MFEPLMLELRRFVDCVRENLSSQVPGRDGLRALQLAEAVASEIARKMDPNPKGLVSQAASAVPWQYDHISPFP